MQPRIDIIKVIDDLGSSIEHQEKIEEQLINYKNNTKIRNFYGNMDDICELEFIRRPVASGKIFLGAITQEYVLRGTEVYINDFFTEGLSDILPLLNDYLKRLKEKKIEPQYFTFDFFYNEGNNHCKKYIWTAIFLSDNQK